MLCSRWPSAEMMTCGRGEYTKRTKPREVYHTVIIVYEYYIILYIYIYCGMLCKEGLKQ